MGRKKDSNSGPKTLPVTVDDKGNLTFDAIILKDDEEEEEDDDEKQQEIEKTTLQTKEALENIVNVRLSAAQPKNVQTQSQDSKFIKYKPSQQSAAFNSGAKERIIRMVEMPVDPLEPPKFKHKRVGLVLGLKRGGDVGPSGRWAPWLGSQMWAQVF
ncbi:putative SKI-interacting protein, SKIP [Helianthus anomalus]